DGLADSIWLDLNMPVTTLPDGRISVPLTAYLVQDADALINLNVAGNLSGFVSLQSPFSGNPLASMPNAPATPVSRSNLGMAPTEINPFWALTADPSSSSYFNPPNSLGNPSPALQQYRGFFNIANA